MNKTLKILTILIVLTIFALFCIFFSRHSTADYLIENGCVIEMSNNEYTNCAEEALKKIKLTKQQSFNKLQDFFKENPGNSIVSDERLNKNFVDWYDNSEKYNHSRCISNMYWTAAGSAYNQNVFTCEIDETQRDIKLLEELYTQRDYFKEYSND